MLFLLCFFLLHLAQGNGIFSFSLATPPPPSSVASIFVPPDTPSCVLLPIPSTNGRRAYLTPLFTHAVSFVSDVLPSPFASVLLFCLSGFSCFSFPLIYQDAGQGGVERAYGAPSVMDTLPSRRRFVLFFKRRVVRNGCRSIWPSLAWRKYPGGICLAGGSGQML